MLTQLYMLLARVVKILPHVAVNNAAPSAGAHPIAATAADVGAADACIRNCLSHSVTVSIVELQCLLYWFGLRTAAHFTSVPDFVVIAYSYPSAIFASAFLLSMSTKCTSSTNGTPLFLPAMLTQ